MSRPTGRHLVVLSLAVSFPLAESDLVSRHACPHHDVDVEAPSHATAHSAAGSPVELLTAEQTPHGEHVAHGEGSRERHSETGPCTCVGACQLGSTAPLLAGRVSLRVVLALERHASPGKSEGYGAARRPYLLPFANAPPSS